MIKRGPLIGLGAALVVVAFIAGTCLAGGSEDSLVVATSSPSLDSEDGGSDPIGGGGSDSPGDSSVVIGGERNGGDGASPSATDDQMPTEPPADLPTEAPGGEAPPPFQVTDVTASVSPSFSANCSQKFTYEGKVTTNGGGDVDFRWRFSGDRLGFVDMLTFDKAETKTVQGSFERQGSGAENGWVELEIVTPNPMTSNRATYRWSPAQFCS